MADTNKRVQIQNSLQAGKLWYHYPINCHYMNKLASQPILGTYDRDRQQFRNPTEQNILL